MKTILLLLLTGFVATAYAGEYSNSTCFDTKRPGRSGNNVQGKITIEEGSDRIFLEYSDGASSSLYIANLSKKPETSGKNTFKNLTFSEFLKGYDRYGWGIVYMRTLEISYQEVAILYKYPEYSENFRVIACKK